MVHVNNRACEEVCGQICFRRRDQAGEPTAGLLEVVLPVPRVGANVVQMSPGRQLVYIRCQLSTQVIAQSGAVNDSPRDSRLGSKCGPVVNGHRRHSPDLMSLLRAEAQVVLPSLNQPPCAGGGRCAAAAAPPAQVVLVAPRPLAAQAADRAPGTVLSPR